MTGAVLGAVLACTGLLWLAGFGLFALACRLSATEPHRVRDARRIAAWLRAGPWLLAASCLLAATGAGLLFVG
ncbi:hypothetical protein [Saccharothrix syringae]|uniref:Uncharacterized protein n=1 Tax=Saccharothrix syringae TaxID=103733 RepID=A0A5Q0H630_SACSY|nr:hypothetical protein [Saccharothrix syringae]QFZ21666.1 hypothetical protein EKG83_33535 [Saccharothrix syringae]